MSVTRRYSERESLSNPTCLRSLAGLHGVLCCRCASLRAAPPPLMLRAAQRLAGPRAPSRLGCSVAARAPGSLLPPLSRLRRVAHAPFSCSRPLHKRAAVPVPPHAPSSLQHDSGSSSRLHRSSAPSSPAPLSSAPSLPLSPPPSPPPSDFERSFMVSPNPAAKPRSMLNKSAFLVTEVGLALGAWLCAARVVRALTVTDGVPSPHDLLPMLFSDNDAALLLLGQSALVLPTTLMIYVAAQGAAAKFWPSVMRVTVAPPPPPPSPSHEATTLPPVPQAGAAESAQGSSQAPSRGYSFFRGTRPRPSLPGMVVLVAVCIAGHVAVLFALQHVDAASPEEPVLIEACLTGGRDLMGIVAGVGPLSEELFFRGFLFARLARVAGVLPALVVSSLLFGVMHWSPSLGSEKVVGASVSGGLFGVVHRLAQTLKAPVLMHSLSNAVSFAQQSAATPLKNIEKLELILQNQWVAITTKDEGIANRKREILRRLGGILPDSKQTDLFSRWLSSDLAALSPAAESLVASLFQGLDRGSKGYLVAEEFAYGSMLSPYHHSYFNAVLGVLERTVAEGSEQGGGLEGAAGAIGGTAGMAIVRRRSAERAAEVIAQAEGNLVRKRPRDRPLMQMPDETFFSAHDRQLQRMEVAPALSDPLVKLSLALPAPPSSAFSVSPGLVRPRGFRLAPALESAHAYTSPHCVQLQRRIVEEYYSAYWSAAFRANFQRKDRDKGMSKRTMMQRRNDSSSADLEKDAGGDTVAAVAAAAAAIAEAPSSSSPVVALPRGCTLPAFSRFVASELLLRPNATVAWLSALSAHLRSEDPSPVQPHPMERLLAEHAKGRQGHLGHRMHGTEHTA